MKMAEKKKSGNIITERPKTVAAVTPVQSTLKRVNDSQLPSHNDSRFDDV